MTADRYLERSFPIVALNPLSVRERNAFKPIYKMHKWFARRSSTIFRAILLGAALPYQDEDGASTDLMAELYRSHHDDPRLRRADGTPMRVLDPFMGGGTTIVEALRLGFEVSGLDYNPVAWFIVKGMTTPVDPGQLEQAFQRLAEKVREPLLELYRTRCPVSGRAADVIYAFWVKQGLCSNPACKASTDLFKSDEVARKRGDVTLPFFPDVKCPQCERLFDWETERCTITAGGPQLCGRGAAGKKRPAQQAFAFGLPSAGVQCPHCQTPLKPSELAGALSKPAKKSVALHVLIDPSTGDFFELRGEVPEWVEAPRSGHRFRPAEGPCAKGKFSCAACGKQQSIVDAADALGAPLPFRCYGFYAHTPHVPKEGSSALRQRALELGLPTNNQKWFAALAPEDHEKLRDAEAQLERLRPSLPLPDQEIYDGYNTNRLVIHGYRRWSQLYGARQLLGLGQLAKAIGEEPQPELRDALLAGFQIALGCMSNLALWNITLNKVERINSAHDYRNPTTIAETNVWGLKDGRGSFLRSFEQSREGAERSNSNWEWRELAGKVEPIQLPGALWEPSNVPELRRAHAGQIPHPDQHFDLVITDPPYAGSVQYAEMSDWYYVWLHKLLQEAYPSEFGSEITLKRQEIIEDGRAKDADWYFTRLTEAWRECHRVLRDEGLLVFTFHHREGDRWTGLLRSLFDAGFYLVAAYPTHSEALNSIVIQATGGITYDIVHVCRKRLAEPESIAWTALRREVQRSARQQLAELERSGDVLPGPDVWMILLGNALQHFSRHYGRVLDADGEPLALDEAISRLRVLLREVRGESVPLPGPLQGVDGLSQLYFLLILGREGWTRDGLHLELRGYAQSVEELEEAELVCKVAREKARLQPLSLLARYASRKAKLRTEASAPLVDLLTLLLGEAQAGLNFGARLQAWRGKGVWASLSAGLESIAKAEASLREYCEMVLRGMSALGEDSDKPSKQGQLF